MRHYLAKEFDWWCVYDIDSDKCIFATLDRSHAIEFMDWVGKGKNPDNFEVRR